jgi:hypothetical protein
MSTLLYVCRCASLCVASVISAPFAFGQLAPPADLKITILDGDNAVNNIRLRTTREPIVQVEDENHNRVPGAVVVFTLPSSGPGGTFLNGTSTLTVTADAQGRATAYGLRPNAISGNFDIRVNASYQGKTGRAMVHQRNFVPPATGAGLSPKWIGVIAGVGVGAAAGIVAATRNGGNPSTPGGTTGGVPTTAATGITVVPGSSTVGPPR